MSAVKTRTWKFEPLDPKIDRTDEHDDASYVPKEMRDYWAARDPVDLYTNYLLDTGGVAAIEIASIDKDCERVMDEAVAYAESFPTRNPRP